MVGGLLSGLLLGSDAYSSVTLWAQGPTPRVTAPRPIDEPLPSPRGTPAAELGPEPQPWELNRLQPAPDEPLADIRIEGATTIPETIILRKLKCRAGRVVTASQVREDVRTLYETRWFFEVQPIYRRTEDGTVLVFRVYEKPVVETVKYTGQKKFSEKTLGSITGLKKGSPFSPAANHEAAMRIEQYYHDKGYYFAKVKLVEGDREEQRNVAFEIVEGHKVYVSDRQFAGNQFFSAGLLRTKLETSARWVPYIGGTYDPKSAAVDIAKLREYYHKLGFFDVKIDADAEFTADNSKVVMKYTIAEGMQYQVRNILVEGNDVLSEDSLRKDFQLQENATFHGDKLNRDLEKMTEKYGELGRLYAEVTATTRHLETPGMVDIVYRINEDKVFRIRRVDVQINGEHPYTKDTVVLNSMLIVPGDLANKKLIDKSERRLRGTQVFDTNVMAGTAPKIRIRPVEDPRLEPRSRGMARAQGYDELPGFPAHPASGTPAPVKATSAPTPIRTQTLSPVSPTETTPKTEPKTSQTLRSDNRRRQQSLQLVQMYAAHEEMQQAALRDVFDGPLQNDEDVVRGQGPEYDPGLQPIPLQDPAGVPPQAYDSFGNPLLAQPSQEPGWVDLVPSVTETQTGRLSFGVGFNSDAGATASVILDESNFDLLRPPSSIREVLDGRAWRGGGQQFRMEVVPGNEVSRYMVSWRDPFFLDTNFSLGVSGFYYSRFFPDWLETRGGGRVTLGRQFDNYWSGTVQVRAEDVSLSRMVQTPPAILEDARGHSFLSSVRVGLQHDTRDSAYMPSEGHYIEAGFEQAFGTFDYPRGDLNARQYFTLYQRPDGEGRHIMALNGQVSYTGSHTPVFERFYAGGYSSFRGFQFRGVTPREGDIGVGGQFMAVGSAEYIFPVTASEMFRGVVFTDFGTVENDVAFKDFRASVGVGARVTVPAMGPLPIALDVAWPLAKQEGDQTRVLSFYMGFLR